jgi:hypothetical protein
MQDGPPSPSALKVDGLEGPSCDPAYRSRNLANFRVT